MVTDVHDGYTRGPLLTDAQRLLLYVRRMNTESFARVFRKQLPDAELMNIVSSLPKDRLSHLMSVARDAQFEPRSRQQEKQRPDQPMARAIRIARKRAGITQVQLAGALGVRQTSVSQWERGATEPTGQRLIELMRALPGLADVLKAQVTRSGGAGLRAESVGAWSAGSQPR
jgi:DNA-binding transcriptional regulator YiaG